VRRRRNWTILDLVQMDTYMHAQACRGPSMLAFETLKKRYSHVASASRISVFVPRSTDIWIPVFVVLVSL